MAQPGTQIRQRPAAAKQDSESGTVKSRKELKALFTNGSLPDQESFGYLIDSFLHRNDTWEQQDNAGANGASTGPTHRISALNRAWYAYVDSQNNLVVAESDAVR